MVIDSIQVSPLPLPFQAWPMMMAPVYGGGGPMTPQAVMVPFQTTPSTRFWCKTSWKYYAYPMSDHV